MSIFAHVKLSFKADGLPAYQCRQNLCPPGNLFDLIFSTRSTFSSQPILIFCELGHRSLLFNLLHALELDPELFIDVRWTFYEV